MMIGWQDYFVVVPQQRPLTLSSVKVKNEWSYTLRSHMPSRCAHKQIYLLCAHNQGLVNRGLVRQFLHDSVLFQSRSFVFISVPSPFIFHLCSEILHTCAYSSIQKMSSNNTYIRAPGHLNLAPCISCLLTRISKANVQNHLLHGLCPLPLVKSNNKKYNTIFQNRIGLHSQAKNAVKIYSVGPNR